MIISRNIGYTIQKKINVMRYSMTFIIGEFTIKPNKQDCKNNNINNYMTECELKVDIISTNSICLRLYKKDFENGDEGDEGTYIGFCITPFYISNADF